MGAILELKNVSKKFGGITACRNISLAIETGGLFGLIGPNGAGKTTVFNLITGVYPVSEGGIFFQQQAINGKRPDQIVLLGIARTFQNIRLFKNLTVLDNVCISVDNYITYNTAECLLRLPKVTACEKQIRETAMAYLSDVGLRDKAFARADSLPYGLQRKLEIARALALKPKLLLIDEPAAGMNPEESLVLADLIRSIHRQYDLTILLIEHHMDVVMTLCDRIFCMNFGEELAVGTAGEIQENPAVLTAYLGEGYRRVGS